MRLPWNLIDRLRFAWWRYRTRVVFHSVELLDYREQSTIKQPPQFVAGFYNQPAKEWRVLLDTGDPGKWLTVRLSYLGVTDWRMISKVLANAHESAAGRAEWNALPTSVQSALVVWLAQREQRVAR